MATLKNTIIDDTGFITIPSGTIAQRPSPAANGMIRYNTDLGVTEYFASNNWLDITTGKPPIVTSGLVLHLDAGDGLSYPGSGNTWFDISGNGNAGTLTNGPTYNSANNGSIFFDGVDDYVWIGNLGSFTSSGTIEFWMNSSEVVNYRNPFHTNYTGSGNNVGIRFEQYTGGGFSVVVGNDSATYGVYSLTTSLQSNAWYNVVITWNTTNNSLSGYLNSSQVFTTTSHTYWPTTMSNVAFGVGFSLSRSFKGLLPSLKRYNRALTATEVQQNFQALRGRYGI